MSEPASRPPSREAIRDAARELFPRQGYAGTSVRDIASRAGVDPALVIRHFGSKEELFIKTMALPDSWTQAMNDGPIEELGEQLVRFLMESRPFKTGGGAYAALVRASDRPEVQRSFQHSIEVSFIEPIVARLDRPDAKARAHLFAAQFTGLLNALWISQDEYVLAMSNDEIVRLYGPSLQSILTGP